MPSNTDMDQPDRAHPLNSFTWRDTIAVSLVGWPKLAQRFFLRNVKCEHLQAFRQIIQFGCGKTQHVANCEQH